MDSAPVTPRPRTSLERLLLHERAVIGVLLAVTVLCWAWILPMARDMYGSMRGPSAWMMTSRWDGRHILLLWLMWSVMMTGMMLPSASPLILLYARSQRLKPQGTLLPVYALAGGYLVVWSLFSVGATGLQRLLGEWLILSPMMTLANQAVSSALLILAGIYQLTPLKRTCLAVCRSPLFFITKHWKPGGAGAFRMGAEHGAYCLGCCWALMLLLFVGGVMNLLVLAALTLFVLLEKLLPAAVIPYYERASGVLLIALGAWGMAT